MVNILAVGYILLLGACSGWYKVTIATEDWPSTCCTTYLGLKTSLCVCVCVCMYDVFLASMCVNSYCEHWPTPSPFHCLLYIESAIASALVWIFFSFVRCCWKWIFFPLFTFNQWMNRYYGAAVDHDDDDKKGQTKKQMYQTNRKQQLQAPPLVFFPHS